MWGIIKDAVTNFMPSVYETNILAAIEERWAMFLHNIDEAIDSSIEKANNEYKKF